MKAKLSEAKRNLATLSARKRAADFKKKVHTSAVAATNGMGELDDNAFAKFDRLRGRVEQAEAEAEALAELRGAPEPFQVEENPGLSGNEDIEAQLRALKNKQRRRRRRWNCMGTGDEGWPRASYNGPQYPLHGCVCTKWRPLAPCDRPVE
jgi:phage shock protein A